MIAPLAAVVLAALPSFAGLSLADAQSRDVAASADVAAARATVVQRQSALQLARGGGIPHLTGDYSLAPQAGQTGDSIVEQHLLGIGAGISINDLLGAPAATRAAAADLLAAQRDADAAALTAREDAVKLYFAALQAVAVASVRARAVDGARRDVEAARLRARNGAAPQLDVVRADVTLARAAADLAQAQADRDDALAALASATGVSPAALVVSAPAATASCECGAPPGEAKAVARALAMRPEIASLLASIDARTAAVATARQSGLPSIAATGGYAEGVDTGVPVRGPTAGVHLDLPLAPGTGDRVATAQAQVALVRAQLAQARRTIALEVAAAVRDARAAGVAAQAAARARDEAQRALSAVELGYREGASSSLDVSDARRVAVQASVDALVAEYRRAQALALLEVIVP